MRKWEDIDKHQTVATKEELSIIDTLSFLEVQRKAEKKRRKFLFFPSFLYKNDFFPFLF